MIGAARRVLSETNGRGDTMGEHERDERGNKTYEQHDRFGRGEERGRRSDNDRQDRRGARPYPEKQNGRRDDQQRRSGYGRDPERRPFRREGRFERGGYGNEDRRYEDRDDRRQNGAFDRGEQYGKAPRREYRDDERRRPSGESLYSRNPEAALERAERPDHEEQRADARHERDRRDDRRFSEKRGGFGARSAVRELNDMDAELIRLINRRTNLLDRIRGDKGLFPETEKTIRSSWESNAANITRDPRVARDFFNLLQSLEPIPTEDKHAFTLAPALRPVRISMAVPADARAAKYRLFLAAASGCPCTFEGMVLTEDMISFIKSLNQLGGDLWYEKDGSVISRQSRGLSRGADKAIYIGSDSLSMWLCLALCLGVPCRLKISGDTILRSMDMSPVSKFAVSLNARIYSAVPGMNGLPVRTEASGVLPGTIPVPADLPKDFVCAMVLAAPFWDSGVTFDLTARAGSQAETEMLRECADLLNASGASVEFDAQPGSLQIRIAHGRKITLPEAVQLPSDAFLAGAIAMIPSLIGGSVHLSGVWTKAEMEAKLGSLLDFCGLEAKCGENVLDISGNAGMISGGNLPACPAPLQTLLAAMCASAGVKSDFGTKAVPDAESFLAQLGFAADLAPAEPAQNPWPAPDARWAMAFALAAYLRPRLRLTNPNVVNGYYPLFWRFYNSLPEPDLKKKEYPHEQSQRRRVIAQGVYGEVPPERDPGDDY